MNKIKTTYLKLQNTVVLEFYDLFGKCKVHKPHLLPFLMRDRMKTVTHNMLEDVKTRSSAFEIQNWNNDGLYKFFTNRPTPVTRKNGKWIYNQLYFPQRIFTDDGYEMMMKCHGLSASDDYWLTTDKDEKWENVNLRANPLYEPLAKLALFSRGGGGDLKGILLTPELTTQGSYAKAWYKENGKLYLYKAEDYDREAEKEVLVSNILDCFNVPHIHYELAKKYEMLLSKCECMNNSEYSTVDAYDVFAWCLYNDKDFFKFAKSIDADLFFKTVIVDYLCSNVDRHLRNWGFFMSNKTGEIIAMHPLFDHNNAFHKDGMQNNVNIPSQMIAHKTLKTAAKYALAYCDFRCTKPVTRSMFFDGEMYFSFMMRAEEIGLYKRKKLSFKERKCLKSDEFEPVCIKKDNTNKYWEKIRKTLDKIG